MYDKIGLHISYRTRLALGRPRIVKLFECSTAYKHQVRAEVGPECLIVVRWWEREQPLGNPEAEAEHWVARHYTQMRDQPAGGGAG